MIKTTKLAPLNSIIVINDPSGGAVPKYVPDSPVMATESCIAVCCYPEQDGETEFTLGESTEVNPGRPPIFQGNLLTPSRKIVLETSELKPILEATTAQTTTLVRIWTNHRKWPDKVIIGID